MDEIIADADKANRIDRRLVSFIERIERLEEEKKGIAGDIKEVYAESECFGYDCKTLRQIVRLRKLDPTVRENDEYLLDTYKRLVGL